MRQVATGSSPVSEERARALFPTPDQEIELSNPGWRQVQSLMGQRSEANAEAQRLLAGRRPTGLTSPEMACWLVCGPDGTARVLNPISVGTERSVGLGSVTRTSLLDQLMQASRAGFIHLHPFKGETAGLSAGDQRVTQYLSEGTQGVGGDRRGPADEPAGGGSVTGASVVPVVGSVASACCSGTPV